MGVNLREFALKSLETAKEDLARDKYLLPVAYVIADDSVMDFTLDFGNAEEKGAAYAELVRLAREKNARAIVTINDATLSDGMVTQSEKPRSATTDCIYATVSGPLIRTWSISIPYCWRGNIIEFQEPTETFDDFLNLLRGWSADSRHVI